MFVQALASIQACGAETDPPTCSLLHANALATLLGADQARLHAEANAAAIDANACSASVAAAEAAAAEAAAAAACGLGDLTRWAQAAGRLEPGLLGGYSAVLLGGAKDPFAFAAIVCGAITAQPSLMLNQLLGAARAASACATAECTETEIVAFARANALPGAAGFYARVRLPSFCRAPAYSLLL
jgi:hypothetical protein